MAIDDEWEDITPSDDSEWEDISEEKPNPVLDTISSAVKQTPFGMAAQGAEAVTSGLNKLMTPFIGVPEGIRKAVSPIFRGSKAFGVGTARYLTRPESPAGMITRGRILPGPGSDQGRLYDTQRVREAYKPDFVPQGPVESLGAAAGENAPVVAASILYPAVGGPMAFAGQQIAQTGKFSPVPSAISAVSAAKPLLRSVRNKALSYVGDVPEESIAYKIENPKLVNQAKDITEIASKDVPQIANKFDQAISGLKSEANKRLSTSRYIEPTADDIGGAFTKDEIINAVGSARKKLGGVYTSEGESASRVLMKVKDNLNKIRSTVSQRQVADLIDDLDNEIPWDKVWKKPEDLTLTDKALIDIRTKLDGVLKTKNTEYAKIMKPLSEQIQARNEYLKTFNLQKVRGEGERYAPSDTTTSRLFGSTRENRLMTKRVLGKTKEMIGEDLEPRVRASQVKADFEPETSRSYRGGEIGVRQSLGRPLVEKLTNIRTPSSPVGVGGVLTTEQARQFIQQAKDEGIKGMEAIKKRAREIATQMGLKW